jgi:hypothetical protein
VRFDPTISKGAAEVGEAEICSLSLGAGSGGATAIMMAPAKSAVATAIFTYVHET